MKFVVMLSVALFVACTSQEKKKTEPVVLNKPVQPLPKSSEQEIPGARKVHYNILTENLTTDRINWIHEQLNQRYFQLSDILPEGSVIKKNPAFVFYKDSEELPKQTKQIQVSMKEDEKFASYRLSISYKDNRNNEKVRHWLFPNYYNEKELSKEVVRTLVRFSFQSL